MINIYGVSANVWYPHHNHAMRLSECFEAGRNWKCYISGSSDARELIFGSFWFQQAEEYTDWQNRLIGQIL